MISTNTKVHEGGEGHLLPQSSSFVTASRGGAGKNKPLLGMLESPAQRVLDKTQIRSILAPASRIAQNLSELGLCTKMIFAKVGFVRCFSTFAFLVITPHEASHNNSRTILCRILDIGQKLRKMWSPIAPLHGFAIETEAVFPRRNAYHISGGVPCPSKVPLIGTPWRTWEMIYKKFPDMHAFFRNGIFFCPQQKHMLKGHFACQQCLGQEPNFALTDGNGRRARKSRNQKFDHIRNFCARDLSPRSCNGRSESLSTAQMSQACVRDDWPIV